MGPRLLRRLCGQRAVVTEHLLPFCDLAEEGRTDLVELADEQVDTGSEAEAYASFINGHLEAIADGATYADLSAPESAAKADVTAAVDASRPKAKSTPSRPRPT